MLSAAHRAVFDFKRIGESVLPIFKNEYQCIRIQLAEISIFITMLTKGQKIEKVNESKKLLDGSRSVIFVDFTGKSVKEMEGLRRGLTSLGAKLKVIKKRLLRIALYDKKIEINPAQFESQVGTVFSPKVIQEMAGPVYKSGIKIIGGYDLEENTFWDTDKMKMVGQLPPREILLGQLLGMLQAPIRMFLYVLDQKSKTQ